jgi:hypothetical protein
MALSITQTPALVSPAQSPIVFTLSENTGVIYSSSFQYIAELYYWTGNPTQSGSVQYELAKYPNQLGKGIFDFSRILNSTLTDLAQANTSNVEYYASDFYWQYKNNAGLFVSSSKVKSSTYKVVDGYSIFQEPIGQAIQNKTPFWPIMTDGPATQSILPENVGTMGIFVGGTGAVQPNGVLYVSMLNGVAVESQTYSLTNNSSLTSGQIQQIPIGPSNPGWPLSSSNADYDFYIQPVTTGVPIGKGIYFENVCKQKYPNIRIKWKNRYGQFDWFNFYMVNRQGFQATKRTYQPQLGTWDGTSLSYENYDSSTLNYISDSAQTLSVNSDYISQDYNEIFKQLLVSDEIYWYYDESLSNAAFSTGFNAGFSGGTLTPSIRPITIKTDSIVFKTGVNDKVIQYGFDFDWGQSYKLLL